MDVQLARRLIACNSAFYRDHAASFSATRSAPWDGWQRVAEIVQDTFACAEQRTVLDVACGNLRFPRFLFSRAPQQAWRCVAVDNAPQLAADLPGDGSVRFVERDILGGLLDGTDPLGDIPTCDLVVSFGFMHHVPGGSLRRALLDSLAARVSPSGLFVLSFWQFMDDARLSAKVRVADEGARLAGWPTDELEAGDHFLGWQDDAQARRYCHHFDETEIDALADHVAKHGMRECARFSADGRTHVLNRYLVCRKEGS